jgi:hypothetical protein
MGETDRAIDRALVHTEIQLYLCIVLCRRKGWGVPAWIVPFCIPPILMHKSKTNAKEVDIR